MAALRRMQVAGGAPASPGIDLFGFGVGLVCALAQSTAHRLQLRSRSEDFGALVFKPLHGPSDAASGLLVATSINEVLRQVVFTEAAAGGDTGQAGSIKATFSLGEPLLGSRKRVLGQFDLAGHVTGAVGHDLTANPV